MPASLTPFSNSRLIHIHIYLFCSLFFPPRFMTKYVCGSFILHRFEWFWFFMFMYFCLISSPSYDNFFWLFVVFIIMHSFSNKTTGSFTHIFLQTFVVVYFPRLLIVLFFCFHFFVFLWSPFVRHVKRGITCIHHIFFFFSWFILESRNLTFFFFFC